ncbi:carbohydrate ABC transporter permease [Nakamurella deserti]|uniref:carbohydrate ABC transporter permease n=1 Tax=Nakamurella deserti TaxID=2164074 RepID=UPI000DBEA7C5|nr:carbohydrate ABC transporter permease [Nakamurella deserti]
MTAGSGVIPPRIEAVDEKPVSARKLKAQLRAQDAKTKLSSPWASGVAIILAILWSIPTLGLFITSFRPVEDLRDTGWWNWFTNFHVTLDNYEGALSTTNGGLGGFFLNTFVITIPAVIIPISLALLAAYAFAWIPFKGRNILFVAVFALQIVPIQVTLIPLQTIFVSLDLQNSFWPVWISHTIFGLPLAIFLLHNFMTEIPRSIIEAARVDGAGHVKIFFVVLMPLLIPAIAAFAIFQFLWVWNDLLVALVFAPSPNLKPLTAAVAELSGTKGTQWELLSSGAFISIIVPLIVFLSLQRYFVRGLLAGGVKG